MFILQYSLIIIIYANKTTEIKVCLKLEVLCYNEYNSFHSHAKLQTLKLKKNKSKKNLIFSEVFLKPPNQNPDDSALQSPVFGIFL